MVLLQYARGLDRNKPSWKEFVFLQKTCGCKQWSEVMWITELPYRISGCNNN